MVAFKILVFFASLKKNHRKGVSQKVGNNCYQGYFRQYFVSCSRVTFFHLNNWDNEGDSE